MPKRRPYVLAVTSDHHTGSTVGVCPPEGVRLDDGGRYLPSTPQLWLWQCWERYWRTVRETVRRSRGRLVAVYNGDLVDGDHHQTHQIISRHPDAQRYVAERVFGVPRKLTPAKHYVIRGTAVHTGEGGSSEEELGQWLQAVRDAGHNWSRYHLRLDLNGVIVDFQHHGRMGRLPWTKRNPVLGLAAQIWQEHAARGLPHPHLAFRSHFHQFADSHDAFPTRVIQTPAWQLKTGYAHRVAAESIADVGGVIVVIRGVRDYEVTPVLYQVQPSPIETP